MDLFNTSFSCIVVYQKMMTMIMKNDFNENILLIDDVIQTFNHPFPPPSLLNQSLSFV